jgi:aminoglycoside 3'-phosphotransferase-1
MSKREHLVEAPTLPATIAPLVVGYRWAQSTVGESGDAVYRLHRPDADGDLYLKHGYGQCAFDLAGEMVRLNWLGGSIPVPQVRHFNASPDEAWLLMTALPGQTAYQLLEAEPGKRIALVDALATFLRQMHSIPVESCPFNSDHRFRLTEARWRLNEGIVDVSDFGADHHGWTADQVWDVVTGALPLFADTVVTHGDFSLDNIIVADGTVVGCIDVGRAGIADRYQDLAILWNCLGDFGAAVQDRLFAAYGISQPDKHKIRFHLALDELF